MQTTETNDNSLPERDPVREWCDEWPRAFGTTVRGARKTRGWTQAFLAEEVRHVSHGAIDLDPTAVTRIEKGERSLSALEAIVIAWAFREDLMLFLQPDGGRDAALRIRAYESQIAVRLDVIAKEQSEVEKDRKMIDKIRQSVAVQPAPSAVDS